MSLYNAQDEERAVCVCLHPFDVIAVALARYLFIGALLILGDVPEVRGGINSMERGFKNARQFSHMYPIIKCRSYLVLIAHGQGVFKAPHACRSTFAILCS